MNVPASSAAVRRRMETTRRRDTPGELELRRILHGWGLRYRVDRTVLPGLRRRADIVFTKQRVAVFVDGCFWHVCPLHASYPKNNAAWWRAKLAANVARDLDTDRRLADAGWTVVRGWEHEESVSIAHRVAGVLARVGRRSNSRSRCTRARSAE